jgi:hypothetical protein
MQPKTAEQMRVQPHESNPNSIPIPHLNPQVTGFP